jgi:hypothetical protein
MRSQRRRHAQLTPVVAELLDPGALVLLQRLPEALELALPQLRLDVGPEHALLAGHLLDLRNGLLESLQRRVGFQTECVTAETGGELPFAGTHDRSKIRYPTDIGLLPKQILDLRPFSHGEMLAVLFP